MPVLGTTYFFSVNLLNRRSNLLVRHVDLLRETVRHALTSPLHIDASVVNLTTCIASGRYRMATPICPALGGHQVRVCQAAAEDLDADGDSPLARRARYLATTLVGHWIQDERDYRYHIDYVHLNPLKHGLVERGPTPAFIRAVSSGVYPLDWCGDEVEGFAGDAN